ncbi:MAG: hypothetical protein RMM28_05680 [Thermoleophilia bacterium]|nr:hypothetical protein [Thermoleophilia bacterium]
MSSGPVRPTKGISMIASPRSLLALALGVMLLVATATHAAALATTPKQLTTRFKQATGERLVLSRQRSAPGRYLAYDLGPPSVAREARWGTFTIYLVTAPAVEEEVNRLLADRNTGALGTPERGNIYWEAGVTLHGERYWMAKRRYGENVVLTWIGPHREKRTDHTFKRLHRALTAVVRG